MRTTTRTGFAAATLIGLVAGPLAVLATPAQAAVADAAASSAPTTTTEKGIVMECSGTARGLEVWTSVYENDPHFNVFEVVIGDREDDLSKAKESAAGFWDGREVDARMKLRGKKVTVTGTAVKVGRRIAVREEFDDGGEHIVSDGFHRRLRHDLVLTYGKKRVPLDCENAFAYTLKVTKEPIA